MQRRHDEAPDLPKDHGKGEDDPAVGADREPRGEPLERSDELQIAARDLGVVLTQVDVRLPHEIQHLVVERQQHDDADHDGEQRADDASAQLRQVLRQRHPVIGGLHVRRVGCTGERELHSAASSGVDSA